MRNFLEKFLISFLLATSILLGLSFWLNVKYGFNLFLTKHWEILSQLQATHTPVSLGFYASFVFALFVFMIGLLAIFYIKGTKNTIQTSPVKQEEKTQTIITKKEEPIKKTDLQPQSYIPNVRPPHLHIPKNMAQIAMVAHTTQQTPVSIKTTQQQTTNQQNPYNSILKDIFKNAGYTVKPNPVISGFTCNLFAIGNNEQLWFGGVDCDINALKSAIEKLKSTFEETLEDIKIHVNSFILDNANLYEDDDVALVFHNLDEIKEFISKHPADKIEGNEQENFDAYSEYMDTIIKYVKNL